MPFIADNLYHKLSGTTLEDGESLMINSFPKDIKRNIEAEELFNLIQEAITSLRRAKVIIDMGNSKITKAYIKINTKLQTNIAIPFIQRLAKVEIVEFVDTKVENSITDVSDNLEVYLPRGEIDLAPIISKLEKQKEKLEKEVQKLNEMLSNEKFVANAKPEVIQVNKDGLEVASQKLAKVQAELDTLN
jgi:valyl-tRNA synthetase